MSTHAAKRHRRRARPAPTLPSDPARDLDGMLRRLHLPTVRRLYAELATRAEQEGMGYRSYLETLVAEEIAHRAETRLTRTVRKARFPFLRTIDDFNFTFQTALRLQMLGSYLGPELVTEGRSAIFSGPSGTGKTHLVIAMAYRAIQHGYEARFVGADALIGALSRAAARGRLELALEEYLHPHVLILDDLGYLSHAADAANVLYRVINDRYQARGRCSPRRTNRWRRGARCSMMGTSPRPSWIACSNAGATSLCWAAHTALATLLRRRIRPVLLLLDSRPQG